MPNTNRDQTAYVPTGNPDTWTEQTLTRPGELGKTHDFNDRTYQRVQLDSGATSSSSVGVVAANQVAYWKDKTKYLVTNDVNQALGVASSAQMQFAAGIFRSAVTAGYYCDIVVRGRNIACADDGSPGVGETIIADATSGQARVKGIALGTASTHKVLGYCRTASSANVSYNDIDIPDIP